MVISASGKTPSTVKSMMWVDPLEEELSETQIPYQLVVLGDSRPIAGLCEDLPKVASVEVVEENPDVPLQTRTIPLDEVKAHSEKWRPSIEAEYESLVKTTEAVEPLTDKEFQELCKNHVVELIPGKSVHTIKAYTGRLKTRGVGCGNYQHGEKRTKLDTFSGGIDAHSLRLMLRHAALRQWKVGTLDVTTAYFSRRYCDTQQRGNSGKSPCSIPHDRNKRKILEGS